jgi:hypothetical protein
MQSKITVISVLALFTLTGAMVWEGAAAVAPGGGLPETGFFVATNSFPTNTAVEITNLENGKTTRAIVFSGLDTPGLLAIISTNAAEMINLSARSIATIRLSQVSDAAAVRSSAGMRGANSEYRGTSMNETVFPPRIMPEATGGDTNAILIDRQISGYAPEIEWADDHEIVDLPEYRPPHTNPPENAFIESIPPQVNTEISAEAPRENRYVMPEEYFIAGIPPLDDYDPVPPVRYEMPEEYFIAGIPPLDDYVPAPPPAEAVIDEDLFIHSFEQIAMIAMMEEKAEEVAEPVINESDIIDTYYTGKVPKIADTRESLRIDDPVDSATPPAVSLFSVPVVDTLDRGKYYVQIGVVAGTELVKKELSRINGLYPLVIQNTGSDDSPMYRILLGPLNQGESGAVLQRFKNNGYADAFIRRN